MQQVLDASCRPRISATIAPAQAIVRAAVASRLLPEPATTFSAQATACSTMLTAREIGSVIASMLTRT
jgi:hypothetical protein